MQLELKRKEDQLKAINKSLEGMVDVRTADLKASNAKLQDYNTALQVLIDKRDRDREELGKRIVLNTRELVIPLLETLRKSSIGPRERLELIKICEDTLDKITSPFVCNLNSMDKIGFTHKEITIANLIIHGKSTQQIATFLNSSESTINFHRNNIRKKLGIYQKGENLQVYLKRLSN